MSNKFNILDNGLSINKISKTYGNKQVVRDVSLSIKRREIVGIGGIIGLLIGAFGGYINDKRKGIIFSKKWSTHIRIFDQS